MDKQHTPETVINFDYLSISFFLNMFYVWCYVLKLSLCQIFSSVSYIAGIYLCILNQYRFKLGILIVLFNSRVWIYWLWIVILNLKFLFCKFIHLFFWIVMRILLFLLMYAKRKKQSPDLTQRDASKEEFGRRVLAGGNMICCHVYWHFWKVLTKTIQRWG